MLKNLFLLGLPLLVITGLWFAFSDAPASEAWAAATMPGALEAASEPGTGQEAPVRPGPGSAALRKGLERLEARDTVEILVALGDTGSPVSGALVSYLDAGVSLHSDAVDVGAGDLALASQVERGQRCFRSNENGIVVVPRPDAIGFVSAAHGQLWGTLGFTADQTGEVLVLSLVPDSELSVRVVDARGRPRGGIPVGLCQHPDPGSNGFLIARSDPRTGVARIRHLSHFLGNRPGEQAFARLALPLERPVESPIDPTRLSGEPVQLALPPTGSLEVALEGLDGAPFTTPCRVELDLAPEQGPASRHPVYAIAENGRVRFPHVGLGLRLVLRIDPTSAFRGVTKRVQGPTESDHVVRTSVVLGELWCTIQGRVLASDGRPAARGRFDHMLTLQTESGPKHDGGAFRTDAQGRFEIRIPDGWSDGRPLQLSLTREDAQGRPLTTRARLPVPLTAGENDIGVLELGLAPVIVRGRVVDERERPIAGARVESQISGGRVGRQRLNRLEGISDDRGAFVLRGHLDEPGLLLTAHHPDHSSGPPVACSQGDQDVVLELAAAGGVTGRLLLDPGIAPGLFDVTARPTARPSACYRGSIAEDGSYELRGLSAGSYRVSLALREEPLTGETLDEVVVQTGLVNELPPLDLRRRVLSVAIDVETAHGARPRNGFVLRRSPGAQEFESGIQPLRQGRIELASLLPSLDLRIEVSGHRPTLLDDVDGDRHVVLEPAPRIRLVLDHGLPNLDAGDYLGVAVERQGSPRQWTDGAVLFDERGLAEPIVKEPGRQDVRVLLWRETSKGVAALVSNRVEATVDVIEGGTFGVQLSEETLAVIEGASRSSAGVGR